MIGKLKGQIDSCFEDHLIIDVKGVGYLVFCTAKSLHNLAKDDFCQLYIETHVREDHIHLYGFLNIEEKECFNILQQVSGIGPRLALTILSYLTPNDIGKAIAAKDREMLRAVSGVGPKMADRMLVELKGKFMVGLSDVNLNTINLGNSEIADDAISALINLGTVKVEAQRIIAAILNKNPEISLNELIKIALRDRLKGSN